MPSTDLSATMHAQSTFLAASRRLRVEQLARFLQLNPDTSTNAARRRFHCGDGMVEQARALNESRQCGTLTNRRASATSSRRMGEARTKPLQIRLNEQERAALDAGAQHADLSTGEWLRRLGLEERGRQLLAGASRTAEERAAGPVDTTRRRAPKKV